MPGVELQLLNEYSDSIVPRPVVLTALPAASGGGKLITPPTESVPRQDKYKSSNLISRAGFVHRSSLEVNEYVGVTWKLLGNGHIISFEPLTSQGVDKEYAVLQFEVQSKILEDCLYVQDVKGECIVTDFITANGALYTLKIVYDKFAAPLFGDDVSPWNSVKRPYHFDLNCPITLHGEGGQALYVGLADGALIIVERDDPLGPATWAQMTDKSPQKRSWLYRDTNDSVPGYHGLSKQAIISIDSNGDHVVTYSIDHTIKSWSKQSRSCIQRIEAVDKQAPLKIRASRHIYYQSSSQGVTVYTPFKGVGHFLFFDMKNGFLNEVENSRIEATTTYAKSWFLVDFVYEKQQCSKITTLWKSNFSCLVEEIHIFDSNEGLMNYNIVYADNASELLHVPTTKELDKFMANVGSMGSYPASTVNEALNYFMPGASYNEKFMSFSDYVAGVVADVAQDNGTNTHLEWMKLDRICREIQVRKSEAVALALSRYTYATYIIRAGFTSMIVGQSISENVYLTDTPSNSKLVKSIKTITSSICEKGWSSFTMKLVELATRRTDEPLTDQMAHLYSSVIRVYLSDDMVSALRTSVEVKGNIEADIAEYISEFYPDVLLKDASPRSKPNVILAEALARLAALCAEKAKLNLEKLLCFSITAYMEGILSSVKDIVRALDCYKSAMSVLQLREPIGGGALKEYSPRASLLEICTSHFDNWNWQDWHLLNELPYRLLRYVSLTSQSSGCSTFSMLARNSLSKETLTRLAKYMPSSAPAIFSVACAYLRNDELAAEGERLARSVSLLIASRHYPELGELASSSGRGLSFYFSKVALKCNDRSPESLTFAKLAAQYGGANESKKLVELALELDQLTTAYHALCTLKAHKDVDARELVLRFLNCAVSKGPKYAFWAIQELPFIGFADMIYEILTSEEIIGEMPSYKLLYMWHVNREDYIGAATAVYRHIYKHRNEPADNLLDLYAIVRNALKCASPSARWMVIDKRVISIDDIISEYREIKNQLLLALPEKEAEQVLMSLV